MVVYLSSRQGYPGPAIFSSIKPEDSSWGTIEEIISQFAGEPIFDKETNIYFVHHFFYKRYKYDRSRYICSKKAEMI